MPYFVEIFEGRVAGLYHSDVSLPPAGAVEISDEAGSMLSSESDFGRFVLSGSDVVLSDYVAPPAIQVSTTSLQFMDRFTEAEQLAIVTATMSVPQVKLWYDRMLCAEEIVFKDARTLAGLQALVAADLITQARMDEVLPEPWR